ncbi:hypothetical protein [Nocardia stercoris]|uniref:hypothetical protein n=1 Tax=Nocardia stercoris TaxID=2483361 RepID=UPI0011C37D8C|nr:hypothetical protein [Nocardia stercoris]
MFTQFGVVMAAQPWRSVYRVAALVVALAGISACDPGDGKPNASPPPAPVSTAPAHSSDVTCREYLTQNADQKRLIVAKVIQEYDPGAGEPAAGFVDLARGGVDLLCSFPSNSGLRVSEAVHRHVKVQIGPH